MVCSESLDVEDMKCVVDEFVFEGLQAIRQVIPVPFDRPEFCCCSTLLMITAYRLATSARYSQLSILHLKSERTRTRFSAEHNYKWVPFARFSDEV